MIGCQTTSGIFKRSETTVSELFEKRKDLIDCAHLLNIYGAPKKINSIDRCRYLSFVQNTKNEIEKSYSYLVFLQNQILLINSRQRFGPRRVKLEINR